MKRIGFLVLCLCLALSVGTRADAQHEVSVRGNVGASFFQSPEGLNSILNSGIDLGLGTTIQLHRGLELMLEGGYDQFTLNGDNLALLDQNLEVGEGSTVEGGTFELWNASLGLRYMFQNQTDAHPYVSVGSGVYRTSIAGTRIYQSGLLVQQSPGRSTIGLGFYMAIGADFRINDTYSFFFEPRFISVDTNDQEFGIGSATQYIPVQMGLDVHL